MNKKDGKYLTSQAESVGIAAVSFQKRGGMPITLSQSFDITVRLIGLSEIIRKTSFRLAPHAIYLKAHLQSNYSESRLKTK